MFYRVVEAPGEAGGGRVMPPTNMQVHYSTDSNEWATPWDIYNTLDAEFHFTLDPCASDENHKCDRYFTRDDDGLKQSWAGEAVFMNPPYGREIGKWIEKAYRESLQTNTYVVCLIPARTDTRYFHDYIMKAQEIRFKRGRIHFNNSKNSAPFPSMLVVFTGKYSDTIPRIVRWVEPDATPTRNKRDWRRSYDRHRHPPLLRGHPHFLITCN
jgi:site-specific DNA-methyltransferase (adenine-specific)